MQNVYRIGAAGFLFSVSWIFLLAVLSGYISISGAVVNLWILVISVTAIALLFYIIATPAYALLHPKPQLVQFVSRNAPRIEIGLLLP